MLEAEVLILIILEYIYIYEKSEEFSNGILS